MPRGRQKAEGETKTDVVQVSIEPKYRSAITIASKRCGRAAAGYARQLLLEDLRTQGLLDELFEPIAQEGE
jgi:hypothetical protein